MSWSPLGAVFKVNCDSTTRIKKVLKVLCEKYKATEAQLLLAWILKHPPGIHPVVGTTNKECILNAVKAVEIGLDLQDWFTLLVASQAHKVP